MTHLYWLHLFGTICIKRDNNINYEVNEVILYLNQNLFVNIMNKHNFILLITLEWLNKDRLILSRNLVDVVLNLLSIQIFSNIKIVKHYRKVLY